jgi:hypothetical protein
MLENTVKTIAQLKGDLRPHFEQEATNLSHIEAFNFKLMKSKKARLNYQNQYHSHPSIDSAAGKS